MYFVHMGLYLSPGRKMIRSGMSCKIVTVFAVILEISATKHWYVTEHGKIQPQVLQFCFCVLVCYQI